MFFKTVEFWGCEYFGSFLQPPQRVFLTIVHTFVCGDDVGASTINANELTSDGTVNVNSETKALTCANSQPMSNSQRIFIYTQKQLMVVILSVFDDFCRKKG